MNNCFTKFKASTTEFSLPEKFTFPFYYEPHPLSVLAAKELQTYLENQAAIDHNFGLTEGEAGLEIGKMFGVLVVQKTDGELGYLSAFSGKLGDQNLHEGFVPPVFDMLTEGSFFNVGMAALNVINDEVSRLESTTEFVELKALLKNKKTEAREILAKAKATAKAEKAARKAKRIAAKTELSETDFEILNEALRQESVRSNYFIKDLNKYWKERIEVLENGFNEKLAVIDALKTERKAKSADLQNQLYEQYRFLNIRSEERSLASIFENTLLISGAGECAAPKLLQYAFLHHLKPISMAEFWWGKSPKSEIRQHKNYYPACRGKCQPILLHMLDGIETDDNPMLVNTAFGQKIEFIYEDDALAIINKPPEFLSVPGKNVQDSVLMRMQLKYLDATGPLVVHRLDMSTTGLMVIAKTKEAHQFLQHQFIKRKVKKRYIALLDGIIADDEGIIDLPLRVDLNDRPRQLVCYEHGKKAVTKWKVVARKDGKTRIHFFPITGRTHQLRVHAAHPKGLNTSIIGDDLYGKKVVEGFQERLHLHAAYLEFKHPITKEMVRFELAAEF
jgi:tRNA pseudouridine32 synthase/23S rRNA pseudouridine746 synthase